MTDDFRYTTNHASAAEIAWHLERCDGDFVPPLSGRVNIEPYAAKLAARARCYETRRGGVLVGLLAAYFPESADGAVHVSNMSVLKEWQGRGIAGGLMRRCLDEAAAAGLARVTLEVAPANAAALALYRKHGFAETGRNGAFTLMTAILQPPHPHE